MNVNHNFTFSTYHGVDCAHASGGGSGRQGLYYSGNTQIIPQQNFTFNLRIYLESQGQDNPRLLSSYNGGSTDYGVLLNYSLMKIVCWTATSTTGFSVSTGGRHLIGVVGNFYNGTFKGYLDGVKVLEWNGSRTVPTYGLSIGGPDKETSNSGQDKLIGGMSKWLVENVLRTDDEELSYFDRTKREYGF